MDIYFDDIMDEIEIEYKKCQLEYNEYNKYLKNRQIVLYINNYNIIIQYIYINTIIFSFFI